VNMCLLTFLVSMYSVDIWFYLDPMIPVTKLGVSKFWLES
jgi:hypothetical protein